jgi:hypothetical protein
VTRLQAGKVKNHGSIHKVKRLFPSAAWRVSEAVTPGLKPPESKAEHSPPFSPDAKNEWGHTSTPMYAFTAHTRTTFLYVPMLIEV